MFYYIISTIYQKIGDLFFWQSQELGTWKPRPTNFTHALGLPEMVHHLWRHQSEGINRADKATVNRNGKSDMKTIFIIWFLESGHLYLIYAQDDFF